MRVLVTGGAGYIGSTVCHYLKQAGHEVFVVDNDASGSPECDLFRVANLTYDDLAHCELPEVDTVVHLAALIEVGESVEDPVRYYNNNVGGLIRVLRWMRDEDVKDIVFASSAAVYGSMDDNWISEDMARDPSNPYGMTKAVGEHLLESCSRIGLIRPVVLRLFNVAGWDTGVSRGESHEPETHLVPRALHAVMGVGDFAIYGDDYDTQDGTCIRDYVHVSDVARAFLIAAENVFELADSTFNIGFGVGASVRQVLDLVETTVGNRVNWPIKERRSGDPSRLVADIRLAERKLGWRPMKNLQEIVKSAYEWEKKRRG